MRLRRAVRLGAALLLVLACGAAIAAAADGGSPALHAPADHDDDDGDAVGDMEAEAPAPTADGASGGSKSGSSSSDSGGSGGGSGGGGSKSGGSSGGGSKSGGSKSGGSKSGGGADGPDGGRWSSDGGFGGGRGGFRAADPADASTWGAAKERARDAGGAQWNRQLHRLKKLQVDGRGIGELLGPILKHTYELPLAQVQKSLVYLGPNARLRRVVHDLIVGRDVRLGAIGGSITHGAKASKIGETDWFSLVGRYLRGAFPRANVTTRNGALPATPSALMNMCLDTYVDPDVDLLFVEYVANDGSNTHDLVKPKVYERLLRKILQKRRHPAVVLVQLMPKGMAFAAGNKEKVPFAATLEDVYGAQAQYYDLPWLSFRNAMWRMSELHRGGFNWTDFMWDVDFMHPIDPGMRAISDMVVNLMQQTALSLLMHRFGPSDKDLIHDALPPPMYPGNHEALNLACKYGAEFAPLVDRNASVGWDFINEGGEKKPKWGFISYKPGSVLHVRVNTVRQSGPKDARTNVMLAYLKSYEKMGRADFECLSGCECTPERNVDALHDLHQSTIFLVRLLVTQSPNCHIGIKLLTETSSKQNKFKISGIMMNEYTGSDVTTKIHEEKWLGDLQATSGRRLQEPPPAPPAAAAAWRWQWQPQQPGSAAAAEQEGQGQRQKSQAEAPRPWWRRWLPAR